MHTPIVLVALALLALLLGSVWLRRADLDITGESRSMLPALFLCSVSVVLILVAAT